MKRNQIWGWLAAFVVCAAILIPARTAEAQAAEALSVGFVDLGRIRREFNAYQTTLAEVEDLRKKEQGNLDEMSGDFDTQVRQYELKSGLWPSEAEKNQKLEELRQKWTVLNEHKMEKDRDLELKSREKLEPLIGLIREGINTVARNMGKHLIFKKSDLAYSDERLDITGQVLQHLNREP